MYVCIPIHTYVCTYAYMNVFTYFSSKECVWGEGGRENASEKDKQKVRDREIL
jgi:hypothetical protein